MRGACPLAEQAKREAPCFGDAVLEHHEFANGECIYCGLPQPGGYKAKAFKPMFEEEE